MTSVQRATRVPKMETKKGAFESSFAAGLDLSEFGGESTANHASAAAELLCVKAEEAQRAAREEQEEARLQNLAKERGQHLQHAQSDVAVRRHAAPQDSHSATDLMENANIGATLVHMHGNDVNGAHHKAKTQKKGKRKLEKAMNGKRPMSQVVKGKKGAVKKSKRSKY